MLFREKTPARPEEVKGMTPWGRWWQALSGNIFSLLLLNLILLAGFLPALACIWIMRALGGLLLVPAAIAASGLGGAVYAAVSRSLREIQFGFSVYLWRTLAGYLKEYFRQGFIAGVICASLWALPLLVLYMAADSLPPLIVVCLLLGILLLVPFAFYTFEQLTRMELTAAELLKNSLLLTFAMGWRSLLLDILWLLPAVGTAFFPNIMAPLWILPGLPVLLCLSGQAVTHSKLEQLFDEAGAQ